MQTLKLNRRLWIVGAGFILSAVLIVSLAGAPRDDIESTLTATPPGTPTPTIVISALAVTKQLAYVTATPEPTITPIPDLILDTPTPAAATPTIITHRVRAGDTLARIASQYDVPVDALVRSNNISNPNTIYVGQELLIPPSFGETTGDLETSRPSDMRVAARPDFADEGIINPLDEINGVPVNTLVLMPEDVRRHVREIYARGQALGRNPRAFSKLGDSTIENPHFLDRFDSGLYDLGNYIHLQPVIDHFAGSFSRYSIAVQRGLHSWSVFDPFWAPRSLCLANETVIACELRVHNPSILFIRLGTNDVGVPDSFERNLRQVVEYSIENGVIPLLGTKADRRDGAGNINNEIIRQVAADYAVPLWDFDAVAGTLPGRGLTVDHVHMTTFYAHDYSSPVAFQRGYGVHNLIALMILDEVWREAQRAEEQEAIPPQKQIQLERMLRYTGE